MLTAQQQVLVQAIEELDLAQVQRLLADGLDPNFMDAEKGPVISVWSDGLFQWWEKVCEAYEAGQPLTEQQKQQGATYTHRRLKTSLFTTTQVHTPVSLVNRV